MVYAVPSSSSVGMGSTNGGSNINLIGGSNANNNNNAGGGGGGIVQAAKRGVKRTVGYFALMCSDSFVQLSSILVIVIIMTGEGMRASIEADEASTIQMSLPIPNLANRPSPDIKMRRNPPTNANRSATTTSSSMNGDGFRGVPDSISDELGNYSGGDDIQRFTFMLYRLIKGMAITSVVDTPCGASLRWLPSLVRQLEFEIPRFRYHCVLHSRTTYKYASNLVSAKGRPGSAINSLHLVYSSKNKIIPKADLALLWHAFGYLEPAHAWSLLRQLNVRYVIVPNYPNVERNAGHGDRTGRVNVRRSPYRFGEPIRIIQDVHKNGTDVKQMLLYEVSTMRKTTRSSRKSNAKNE